MSVPGYGTGLLIFFSLFCFVLDSINFFIFFLKKKNDNRCIYRLK